MSVDVVTLSLSRYFSGAYAPPSFENALQRGEEAEVHHIDGSISVVVKGAMLGGPDALANYQTWREKMPAYKAVIALFHRRARMERARSRRHNWVGGRPQNLRRAH
ncbi:MAG: hypothetical protein GY822_16435 [Deltaproteobacteria bacterium]|nr:hypothetical protein [Deltaproteobacteria bacterium]